MRRFYYNGKNKKDILFEYRDIFKNLGTL